MLLHHTVHWLIVLCCPGTELPVKWIKELEEDTSALKGQPLYMTCELNKERDVKWKKNGEVLKKQAGKVQINIIGMQHAVTIQGTTLADAGLYSCEVANQEEVKTATNVKIIGEPDRRHRRKHTAGFRAPWGHVGAHEGAHSDFKSHVIHKKRHNTLMTRNNTFKFF